MSTTDKTKSSSAPPSAPERSFASAEGSFLSQAKTAVGLLVAMTLLTGVAYPLLVTGVAKAAFPEKANGSLIVEGGKVRGSRLIGQPFDDPKHFWGRLSATAPSYNAASSTGSNLGPTNQALTKAAQARVEALRAADPGNTAPVPVDLVTASGSGLDPHISVAAAEYQVSRVARTRGIPETRVRALVHEHTDGRDLGVLGEPGVNVLTLNLALEREAGQAGQAGQDAR
jgi:K+-transporting ATPase ATPase C chain